MKPSIIQSGEPQCYLCGRRTNLEHHHILGGVANRKLSDRFGLWVWLDHDCHTGVEGAQYNSALNKRLKQDAQRAFESIYDHEMWVRLFRKNYL